MLKTKISSNYISFCSSAADLEPHRGSEVFGINVLLHVSRRICCCNVTVTKSAAHHMTHGHISYNHHNSVHLMETRGNEE